MATKISNNNSNRRKKGDSGKKAVVISLAGVLVVLIAIILIMAFADKPEEEKMPDISQFTESVTDDSGETPKTEAQIVPDEDVKNLTPVETDLSFLEGIDTTGATDIEVIMTDSGRFVMTVLPAVAPKTVENFLILVDSGFYNGLTFHRIIEGFMAQGGDPEGTGAGGSDTPIKGEFASNGFDNPLPHARGVVSMARTNDPDSASSQFFICYEDTPYLDGEYATFGYVKEGMEVVDNFLSAGTDSQDRPNKEVRISSMKVIK